MANNNSWEKIFQDYRIKKHNFKKDTFVLTAKQIKTACQPFLTTGEKEVRILCKQDSREDRPQVFKDNNLFLLPTKNGIFAIVKGEGYINLPEISSPIKEYQ